MRNDINFEIKYSLGNNEELTLKDAIGDLPIDYMDEIQHIGTKHKCNVNGFLGNRELKWDEPSPTITGKCGWSGGLVIHNHPSLKRRLTMQEYKPFPIILHLKVQSHQCINKLEMLFLVIFQYIYLKYLIMPLVKYKRNLGCPPTCNSFEPNI